MSLSERLVRAAHTEAVDDMIGCTQTHLLCTRQFLDRELALAVAAVLTELAQEDEDWPVSSYRRDELRDLADEIRNGS